MAKKKQELSSEELLEQALVREEDWPYEVPGNWVWTRLGSVTSIIGGGTPSSNVSEYYENGNIPWISPADLSHYTDIYISHGRKYITELGLKKSSARLMPPNTVMLSSRAPIGYVVIAENEIATNQGFKSFLPSSCYLPKYLYFYLKNNKELLESYASGTTFLELSGKNAALVEFPLPPLAEQQRIVDRIESLFDKLDQAKDLIQDALDSFEIRKAAILHQAFTGELTKKWREAHGVGMESWEEVNLGDVVNGFKYGTSEKSDYSYKGIPVLRIPNILNDGLIDSTDLKYLAENSQIDKYSLQEGDVLIIRSNGSRDLVGKSAMVYESEIGYAYASYLIRMRPTKIIPRYLVTLMNSSIIRDQMFKKAKSSAGINNINTKELASLKFKLPSHTEQQEIVRILDDLFAKEQNAKDLCDLIDQIEAMKKTILGQAFRGELGTNEAGEESAVELLKVISK